LNDRIAKLEKVAKAARDYVFETLAEMETR
jgi:hypothetical protein